MSHSKYRNRGRSFWLENWRADWKKHLRTCALRGFTGFDPKILELDCKHDEIKTSVRRDLEVAYQPIELDEHGVCGQCRKAAPGLRQDVENL